MVSARRGAAPQAVRGLSSARHERQAGRKSLEAGLVAWARGPNLAVALPIAGSDRVPEPFYFRCWARCLFISNIVTLSLPNTFRSLSSARISRPSFGFCSLLALI